MVRIGLQVTANLDHVKTLKTCGNDFRWYLKLKCANCGQTSESWQYITLDESFPLKGGRGTASMVEKCKLCSRENSINIVEEKIKPITSEDNRKPIVIVGFDCRGMEPVGFDFRNGWTVESSLSNKVFDDISLSDNEWYDYDEEGGESISINEISYAFVKLKDVER